MANTNMVLAINGVRMSYDNANLLVFGQNQNSLAFIYGVNDSENSPKATNTIINQPLSLANNGVGDLTNGDSDIFVDVYYSLIRVS